MLIQAIMTYHPVRTTALFFVTAFILLTSPFWHLSNGINLLSVILHYGLVYYIVFKIDGLNLYREYGAIINKAESFNDLKLYTDHFVKDKRYQKIMMPLYIGVIWAVFGILSIF